MAKTAYDKTDERLIVALARQGDSPAFAELVRRHQVWIRGLMYRFSGDSTLAEDLAQQTFLQAWRDISRLKEPAKFLGWLKRIAINVWLKQQRKQDPLSQASEVEHERSIQSRPGLALDLDQALMRINSEPRSCVILAYQEGMSHSEIATVLKMPVGTVKSHIRRASQQLRTLLGDYEDGEST